MSVIDKEKLSHWESAKIGDIIQLKDEQTISFLMDEGHENLTHGADFTVQRIRKIPAQEGNASWLVLSIEFADFSWCLIVKSDGSDFDLYVYYVPEGFVDGDRNDIIDNSDWLMEEWDEDKVELKDLPFASEIQQDEDIIFKTNGAEYGTCNEDGDKSFVTVVEYSTDDDEVDNPLMIAIEFNQYKDYENSEENEVEDEDGDLDVETTVDSGVVVDEDSSYIMLLQGCSVTLNDVDILRI
jgi:hypothetical protein